jgi:hypothetical protein
LKKLELRRSDSSEQFQTIAERDISGNPAKAAFPPAKPSDRVAPRRLAGAPRARLTHQASVRDHGHEAIGALIVPQAPDPACRGPQARSVKRRHRLSRFLTA